MHKQRMALLIAAGLGVLGCFLPWVTFPLFGSINGLQAAGGNVLLAAFVPPALIALLGARDRPISIALVAVASIIGTLAGADGLLKIIDFNQAFGKVGDAAGVFGEAIRSATSLGIGLYLVVAAGLGIPLSQFMLR
jgi:hypothetical protein